MNHASLDRCHSARLYRSDDPAGGNYHGIQRTDLWFSSVEYANRQTCMSGGLAVAGPDGAYTFVIGAKDPGVFIWLDTSVMSSCASAISAGAVFRAAVPDPGCRGTVAATIDAEIPHFVHMDYVAFGRSAKLCASEAIVAGAETPVVQGRVSAVVWM